MSSTMVLNLATGEEQYYALPPERAVIAAYAQSLNDWNTWDYATRYASLLMIGRYSVSCGDFSALKQAQSTSELGESPVSVALAFVLAVVLFGLLVWTFAPDVLNWLLMNSNAAILAA